MGILLILALFIGIGVLILIGVLTDTEIKTERAVCSSGYLPEWQKSGYLPEWQKEVRDPLHDLDPNNFTGTGQMLPGGADYHRYVDCGYYDE